MFLRRLLCQSSASLLPPLQTLFSFQRVLSVPQWGNAQLYSSSGAFLSPSLPSSFAFLGRRSSLSLLRKGTDEGGERPSLTETAGKTEDHQSSDKRKKSTKKQTRPTEAESIPTETEGVTQGPPPQKPPKRVSKNKAEKERVVDEGQSEPKSKRASKEKKVETLTAEQEIQKQRQQLQEQQQQQQQRVNQLIKDAKSLTKSEEKADRVKAAGLLREAASILMKEEDYNQAVKLLTKSLHLFQENLTEFDLSLCHVISDICLCSVAQNGKEEAVQYIKDCITVFEKNYGNPSHALSKLIETKGELLINIGKEKEGLQTFTAALEVRKKMGKGEDVDSVSIISSIGLAYDKMEDHRTALGYHKRATELYKKLSEKDEETLAGLSTNIGFSLSNIQRFQEALDIFLPALEVLKGHPGSQLVVLLNNIASCYHSLGKFSESYEFQTKSFKILDESLPHEAEGRGVLYNNLASTLSSLERHEEALEFYKKSLEAYVRDQSEDSIDVAGAHENIGSTLHSLGKYTEAVNSTLKAIEILRSHFGKDTVEMARPYSNLGSSYLSLSRNSEAIRFLSDSVRLFEQKGEIEHDFASACANLGAAFQGVSRYSEALKYHCKALEIIKALGQPEDSPSFNIYFSIGNCYLQTGKPDLALDYFRKGHKLLEISGQPNPGVPSLEDLTNFVERSKNSFNDAKEDPQEK